MPKLLPMQIDKTFHNLYTLITRSPSIFLQHIKYISYVDVFFRYAFFDNPKHHSCKILCQCTYRADQMSNFCGFFYRNSHSFVLALTNLVHIKLEPFSCSSSSTSNQVDVANMTVIVSVRFYKKQNSKTFSCSVLITKILFLNNTCISYYMLQYFHFLLYAYDVKEFPW